MDDTPKVTTQPRPPELKLTFAELEALLATEPNWPAVRHAMGTRPPADDQVAAAGWATLLVRNLARQTSDGGAQVANQVAQMARRVGRASVVIGVVQTRTDTTVLPMLLCTAGQTGDRALVRVAGPGVVAVTALPHELTVPDHMAVLVDAAFTSEDGTIVVQPPKAPGIKVRKTGDQWAVADSSGQFHEATRDQALGAVRSCAVNAIEAQPRRAV